MSLSEVIVWSSQYIESDSFVMPVDIFTNSGEIKLSLYSLARTLTRKVLTHLKQCTYTKTKTIGEFD